MKALSIRVPRLSTVALRKSLFELHTAVDIRDNTSNTSRLSRSTIQLSLHSLLSISLTSKY